VNVRLTILGIAAFLALAPVTAFSQDEAKAKATKVAADLAYIKTGGNTEVTTVSTGDKLEHKMADWLFTQDARAVWGETDGVETAGRYDASLRADYLFSKPVSAYALGAWDRNTFAGISRQFEEGIGLSWHVTATAPHKLDLDGGVGLIQRRTTLAASEDFTTARTGLLYQYHFTEKAYFEAHGAYLFNLDDGEDGQGEAQLALVAPISGAFSMKLGYDLSYRNRPLPGLEKLDTTFSAGIQFSR